MAIERIIVGTDFSEASVVAIERALHLARHLKAELLLLHFGSIVDETSDIPSSSSSAAAINQLALAQLAADHDQLEKLRVDIEGRGVKVTAELVDAFPDVGLCDAAIEQDAGLVVMGTHGRTGLSRFLLGSVADRVVRNCKRPVMVARAEGEKAEGGFRRILVPTDFSELADRALDVAFQLVKQGGIIELLHCWQVPVTTMGYELEPLIDSLGHEVDSQGEALLAKHRRAGVDLAFSAKRDAPAQGIQIRLEQEPFDCVIMSSHGRRGLSRFLLGSVAEATVRHAPCSVIVVPAVKA